MNGDGSLPIEAWLAERYSGGGLRTRSGLAAEYAAVISQLKAVRRGTTPPPKRWPSAAYFGYAPMKLSRKHCADLAQLQPWLWEQHGPNIGDLRMTLLATLAAQADPALLDLWRESLRYLRPRDKEGPQRRRVALCAVGLLLLEGDEPGSEALELEALLLDALGHSNAQTVGDAARVLMGLHKLRGQPANKAVIGALQASLAKATKQPARLRLRRALESMGVAPNDVGSWVVRVWLQEHPEATRTLELGAGRTLDSLHHGVQAAFGWDADHAYSFFPRGTKVDRSLEVSAMGHGQFYGEDDTWDADLLAGDVLVGDVVSRRRQRFLYLFDYGDQRMFVVEVVGVGEGGAKLAPRLVASEGEAPVQYGWFG